MKFKVLLSVLILSFVMTSCAPRIHYMGDSYDPINNNIDVFYNKEDVEKKYKTIGKLTHDSNGSDSNEIKKLMVETARQQGADAIIFDGFGVQQSFSGIDASTRDNIAISASAILYND